MLFLVSLILGYVISLPLRLCISCHFSQHFLLNKCLYIAKWCSCYLFKSLLSILVTVRALQTISVWRGGLREYFSINFNITLDINFLRPILNDLGLKIVQYIFILSSIGAFG